MEKLINIFPKFPEPAIKMLAEAVESVDWGPLGWLEAIPHKSIYDLLGSLRHHALNHQRAWDMSRLTLPGSDRGDLLARYWRHFAKAEFYKLVILARTNAADKDISFTAYIFIDACRAAAYWQANPGAAIFTDNKPKFPGLRSEVEAAFRNDIT